MAAIDETKAIIGGQRAWLPRRLSNWEIGLQNKTLDKLQFNNSLSPQNFGDVITTNNS